MASSSLCGESIGSRRALLAALWSLVTILTFIAFLTALTFTLSARNLYKNDDGYNYYNNEGEGWGDNSRVFVGDPRGALAYWAHMDAWRNSGAFEGLEFR